MNTRNVILLLVGIVLTLGVIFDGMRLLGFSQGIQYAYNIGYFVVALPALIASSDLPDKVMED